jgi:hypothetical protein
MWDWVVYLPSTTCQDKVIKPLSPPSDSLIICSLSYSITWQDKVNKPLGPTSDSADYLFFKLQYYTSGQGPDM